MSAPAQDNLYEDEADDIELDDDDDSTTPEAPPAAAGAAAPAAAAAAAAAPAAAQNEAQQLQAAAALSPSLPDGGVLLETPAAAAAAEEEAPDTRACVHCGEPIGHPRNRGAETLTGPLHLGCVLAYKFLHQPRCAYCRVRFQDGEASSFVKDEKGDGGLYHAACFALKQKGQPFVRPAQEGDVRKFAIARSRLSRKNWKHRYFVLSEANGGICYYEDSSAKKDKKEKAADRSSSSDDDDDEKEGRPNPPGRTASANTKAMTQKGFVPLKDERNRLLSRPFFSKHRVDSNGDEQNAIGILFYDGAQSTQQRRLVFQCQSKEEYRAWLRALEAYIYTVDDPTDYENEEALAAEQEAAKEREKKEKKEKKKEEKDKKKEKK